MLLTVHNARGSPITEKDPAHMSVFPADTGSGLGGAPTGFDPTPTAAARRGTGPGDAAAGYSACQGGHATLFTFSRAATEGAAVCGSRDANQK